MHVGQRFKRDIWIDRAGAVADEQAEVMDFARLAGFDHQAALGANAQADQVMMDGGRRQQAGNRSQFRPHAAIGKNEDRRPVFHGVGGHVAQFRNRALQALSRRRPTRNSIGIVTDRRSPTDTSRSLARSVLLRIGCFSLIRWHALGDFHRARLPSRPK